MNNENLEQNNEVQAEEIQTIEPIDNNQTVEESITEINKKPNKKKLIIALISVLVIAIIAVTCYFAFFKDKDTTTLEQRASFTEKMSTGQNETIDLNDYLKLDELDSSKLKISLNDDTLATIDGTKIVFNDKEGTVTVTVEYKDTIVNIDITVVDEGKAAILEAFKNMESLDTYKISIENYGTGYVEYLYKDNKAILNSDIKTSVEVESGIYNSYYDKNLALKAVAAKNENKKVSFDIDDLSYEFKIFDDIDVTSVIINDDYTSITLSANDILTFEKNLNGIAYYSKDLKGVNIIFKDKYVSTIKLQYENGTKSMKFYNLNTNVDKEIDNIKTKLKEVENDFNFEKIETSNIVLNGKNHTLKLHNYNDIFFDDDNNLVMLLTKYDIYYDDLKIDDKPYDKTKVTNNFKVVKGSDNKDYLTYYGTDRHSMTGQDIHLFVLDEYGRTIKKLVHQVAGRSAVNNDGSSLGYDGTISYKGYTKIFDDYIMYLDFGVEADRTYCQDLSGEAKEYKITIDNGKLNYELVNTHTGISYAGATC